MNRRPRWGGHAGPAAGAASGGRAGRRGRRAHRPTGASGAEGPPPRCGTRAELPVRRGSAVGQQEQDAGEAEHGAGCDDEPAAGAGPVEPEEHRRDHEEGPSGALGPSHRLSLARPPWAEAVRFVVLAGRRRRDGSGVLAFSSRNGWSTWWGVALSRGWGGPQGGPMSAVATA